MRLQDCVFPGRITIVPSGSVSSDIKDDSNTAVVYAIPRPKNRKDLNPDDFKVDCYADVKYSDSNKNEMQDFVDKMSKEMSIARSKKA